ncbi:MAG: hypothetical protein M3376_04165 [Actinomycetota bacterium]|nr:hypothetical protein [Actinomycetota bacterium]
MIALVIASGGVAYATIPDSGGVIHSCYSSGSGSLRVIDSDRRDVCKSGETPLTFNQTGPEGPPGEDGADGEDGLDGEDGGEAADGGNGADDALQPSGSSEAVSAPDGTVSTWGRVFAAQRSIELPAGRWVITTTAVANNDKRAVATFDCRLRAGGKVIDSIKDIPLAATATAGEREAFAMTGAARLAGAGSAELQCRSAAPGNVRSASITAISVETISNGS